jgi:hypothetical protein
LSVPRVFVFGTYAGLALRDGTEAEAVAHTPHATQPERDWTPSHKKWLFLTPIASFHSATPDTGPDYLSAGRGVEYGLIGGSHSGSAIRVRAGSISHADYAGDCAQNVSGTDCGR